MSEPFPIWITKYCLSAGIEEATAYAHPVNAEWVIVVDGRFRSMVLTGDQWHESKAKAVAWAESLRKRTIERDQTRLEELKELKFTEDEG